MRLIKVLKCITTMLFITFVFVQSVTAAPKPDAKADLEPILTLTAQCGLPFKDNAVLQQKIPLPIWGSTLPGAKVSVHFDQQTKTTIASANGNWRVTLDPMNAIRLSSCKDIPNGKAMTIICKKDGMTAIKTVSNLVMGEVWISAGQSNMAGAIRTIILKSKGKNGVEMNPNGLLKANKFLYFPADTITSAKYPGLRQMTATKNDPWLICSPQTVPYFKKVAYFFGSKLFREIQIPIGLIPAAKGGSKIESWLNQKPYELGQNYSKYISPILNYGIRGVLWYQGESNSNDKRKYLPKLQALIHGWRKAWNQPQSIIEDGPQTDFSFYFVQLPGIGISSIENPEGGDGRAEIRQTYFDALSIKNTGMAITIDIGAIKEHPPGKVDTGFRLANLAIHHDYGVKDHTPSGPLYKQFKIVDNTIRISFDYAEEGLMIAEKKGYHAPKALPAAKLPWLSIQAKSGAWHWADGQIDGGELIVSSPKVKVPVAVRYAYTNNPSGNLLYNKNGLPVGPFSTNGYSESK